MGRITQLGGRVFGANIIYFWLTPAPVDRAGCNTHSTYQFMIDISTVDGKALYSSLLMAVGADKEIAVQGTGICGSTSIPLETVRYWVLQPP